MPQFRGKYLHSYNDETGSYERIIEAPDALGLWRVALWSSADYRTLDDIADGFDYTRWPEKNAKNLSPHRVSVRRIKEEDDTC